MRANIFWAVASPDSQDLVQPVQGLKLVRVEVVIRGRLAVDQIKPVTATVDVVPPVPWTDPCDLTLYAKTNA